MTIESILTEWRYRLKKGYPDQPSDYDILAKILIEDVGIDPIEAKQIANKARSPITSNLLTELWRLNSPADLIERFDELEQYAEKQDIHKEFQIKDLVKDIKRWTDAELPAPLSVYEFIEIYPKLQTLLFHADRATWNEFRNRITKAITDLRANDVATFVTSSTPIAEPTGSRFTELNLPETIVNQINQVYNGLSPAEKLEFDKNYRTHSIQSYVESGYKAFEKFFLVNVGGARGGMGNGEISVLLGVAESKPGGTAQHDIVMPTGEWEVKELKDGRFDPAGEGRSSRFELTEKIQNFYKDIVLPVDQIGDPYEQLHHLVDPSSHEQLKQLIMIFETRFSEAIDMTQFKKLEWKKTAFSNWYTGFKELHAIFYKTKLDTSIKDTRLTVNTDGNEEAYWIDDDDVNSIRHSAGTDDTADILIGDPVSDVNNDIIIWFKRLARNEFIREPNNFIVELNKIKSSFFNSVAGLIWYDYRNPTPYIGLPDEFAIDQLSLGVYRFVRKNISKNRGYLFIEQQS